MPTAPVDQTLKITFTDADENKFTMEYVSEEEITDVGVYSDEVQKVLHLAGDLGEATYNTATRELEIQFNEEEEGLLVGGNLTYEYYPKYYLLPDISLQDEIFNKLFASKILEALASLRAQSTQEVLHNIDLTTDELYTRVRILKRELNQLLRNTIKFSGMAHI